MRRSAIKEGVVIDQHLYSVTDQDRVGATTKYQDDVI
jgi:hypothetical protein